MASQLERFFSFRRGKTSHYFTNSFFFGIRIPRIVLKALIVEVSVPTTGLAIFPSKSFLLPICWVLDDGVALLFFLFPAGVFHNRSGAQVFRCRLLPPSRQG